MNCRKIEEILSAYIDKEVNAREKVLIEKHLSLCPQCRKVHERLLKAKNLLCSLPILTAPANFTETILKDISGRIQPASIINLISSWFIARNKLAWGIGFAAALFLGIFLLKNFQISLGTNITLNNLHSEHLTSIRKDPVCMNSRSVTFLASSNFVLTSGEGIEKEDNNE